MVEFSTRRGIMVFLFNCTAKVSIVVVREDVVVLVIVAWILKPDPIDAKGFGASDQVVVFSGASVFQVELCRLLCP